MNNLGTVTLETERLILRRFVLSDLQNMYDNCFSDYDVWKWTNYKKMDSIDDVMIKGDMFTPKWFEAYNKPTRYSWAIVYKETGEVIGRMFGMHLDCDIKEIELTYELGKKWWNKGIMTETVKKVIKFFFDEVDLNRIYAYHTNENLASGRVMQKAGMIFEGVLRQGCICNKGIYDKIIYGILKSDYLKQGDK